MIPGSYDGGGGDEAMFPQVSSGSYRMDPRSGSYMPQITKARQTPGFAGGLNDIVRALMTGYLRRGGGGMTSEAPGNILQHFKANDPYSTYGVPYTGINYKGTSGPPSMNPYKAMFSSPTGDDY